MSHRHLRILAILAVMLAGSLGALQSPDMSSLASAQESDESEIQLPIRWCAVQGSTAAANPGDLGEPDTDSVLLSRQQRANELVWQPGAQIVLRSAFTSSVIGSETFPIIDDPNPPANGGPDDGSIVDPREDAAELNAAVAACREAWDAIAVANGTPLLGPIALNIGQFVDSADNPVPDLDGWGGYSTWSPKTAHPCVTPSGATTASGGFIAVEDFSVIGDPDADARLVAHEIGHVLLLGHGNGEDDDDNEYYDLLCDPWESPDAPPNTVMHRNISAGTEDITPLQRGTSRDIASIYTGSQIDSDGTLVNGPSLSDQRADSAGDVDAPSVDVTYVELVLNESFESVTLTQALLGLVYPDQTNEYFAFLDLDSSVETGGSPEFDLGLPTLVEGIDLVTHVTVDGDRHASVTVWRYEDGQFVDVTDEGVEVQLTSPEGGEEPTPMFDIVSVTMGLGTTGTIGEQVSIQVVATDRQHFDVIPGAGDAEPSSESATLLLIPPDFESEG